MIISLIGRIFLYAAIIRLMGGVFLFCRIVRGFFAFASGISFTFGIPVRLVSFICIIFLGTVFFGLAFILSISPMISLIPTLFLGFAAFLAAAIIGCCVIRLSGISFIIAIPITWLLLNRWLENFVYHTDMNIGIYLISGFFVLLITLLTVSWHSYKAASGNPVKVLRSE